MEEIWIIGLGQFGSIAFQRLAEMDKNRHFVLVDPVKENLRQHRARMASLKISDGIQFLETNFKMGRKPDWIIPALPIHLAAEWVLMHLGTERLRRISLPIEIESLLPNSIWGTDGNIYVSHADFMCPDDCDEPQEVCTITRERRKQNMFDLLGSLDIEPYEALCIRSHQLGPGIGGYRYEQLIELMEKVDQSRGAILLSTACRCHGVITGLEKIAEESLEH